MKSLYVASLLVFCALCVTEAQASRGWPIDKVIAVGGDGTLTMEHAGPPVLAGLYYPDPARAADWLKERVVGAAMPCHRYGADRYDRQQITLMESSAVTVQYFMVREGVAVAYDRGLDDWTYA